MEEKLEDVKDQRRTICEECRENPFKYKCPGCGLRSCSLPCVKAHKLRTRCAGKRNRTQFVPLSQFDENWLISDYNLLEEILRMTEAARRTRGSANDSRPGWHMRGAKRRLQIEAKNRNINLLLQPKGMSKNKINKSFYDPFHKCFYWTVEWQFHSTGITQIKHKVDEHACLQSILEKHLNIGPGNPVMRHKLRHFCSSPIESLKLLLKKEHMGGDKKLYFDLNVKEPLRSQLAWKTIIEYPVILVVLQSNLMEFELSDDVNPVSQKVKPSKVDEFDYLPYQECTTFKEEEIEEKECNPFKEEEIEEKEKPCTPFREEETEEKKCTPFKEEEIEEKKCTPFKEEEIEERELETSEDLYQVPEKAFNNSNIDEPNLNLEDIHHEDEEIMEREFGFIKDMNLGLEKTLEPSNADETDYHVHLEGFPIREAAAEQGENAFFENPISVPDKNLRPSNFDELDDLVHLDDLGFRDDEIEEGEFVPHQHFDGSFSLQMDMDSVMDGVNDEIL